MLQRTWRPLSVSAAAVSLATRATTAATRRLHLSTPNGITHNNSSTEVSGKPGNVFRGSSALAGADLVCAFTPEQLMLLETSRRFAAEEIAPRADAIDRLNDWRLAWPSMWEELGAMGLLTVTVPEEYGGAGLGYVEQCIALESINRASASVGISVGAHGNLCANQIVRNGTVAQKSKFLPKLCSGEFVGALAMSEPATGSDVLAMGCRATTVDGGYVLNGSKYWCTNGPDADVLVVYAKTDPDAGPRGVTAFLVEKTMSGFSTGPHIDKVGHRGSNTGELIFENCFVPEENVLGGVGQGARVLMSGLDIERVVLSAGAIGVMAAALDVALPYVHERKQFGRPIGLFQLMQAKLADMYGAYLMHRTTMYALARAYDEAEARQDGSEKQFRKETACLILAAGEACERAASESVQALGGAGYTNDFAAGRLMRDAKLFTIGGGTSEIRRMLAGRELFEASKGC